MVQAQKKPTPEYKVTKEEGPSHSPTFEVSVFVQTELLGTAVGKNKKQAEQEAAKAAITKWIAKNESK